MGIIIVSELFLHIVLITSLNRYMFAWYTLFPFSDEETEVCIKVTCGSQAFLF